MTNLGKLSKPATLLLLMTANSLLLGQDGSGGFGNTPANPDPSIYTYYFDIKSWDHGEPIVGDPHRTSISRSKTLSCEMCNNNEPTSARDSFNPVIVNTYWSITIPNVGFFSGGNTSTSLDLSAAYDCPTCTNTQVPFYEYNATGTVVVPYIEKLTARFCSADYTQTIDVPYPYVVPHEQSTTYSTKEAGLGTVDTIGCDGPQCAPCN